MQRVAGVRLQVPERHHVRVADGRVDGLLQDRVLHRVERIDAAAAPVGTLPHPGVRAAEAAQRPPCARDDREPVQHPVEQREPRVLRDLRQDGVRREARVGPRLDQEPEVLLRRGLVRRPPGDDDGRVSRPETIARRVAHRAVDRDAGKPDRDLREADRHLVAVLRHDAGRGVSARSRQIFGEDARQHEPDPVRDALFALGADRSEQEVLFVRREVRRRLLAEEFHIGDRPAHDREDNEQEPEDRVTRSKPSRHATPPFSNALICLRAIDRRIVSGTRKTKSNVPNIRYSGGCVSQKKTTPASREKTDSLAGTRYLSTFIAPGM